MNGSLAMRSTRLRTLLLCLVGGGMVLSLYLLTSSQYHLKDAKHALEACQQQKDSLLAQLQVVYEQKNRVEKSLQQERLDHRKTQEDNQKNNFIRLQVQKAKVEVDTKLSALQQDQQTLQERYHELESQTAELRDQQTKNEGKRVKQLTDFEQSIKIKDVDILLLQGNLSLIIQERDKLESQIMQLNRDIKQFKSDILHYKKMYLDMEARLKKLSEPLSTTTTTTSSNMLNKSNNQLQPAPLKADDPGYAEKDTNNQNHEFNDVRYNHELNQGQVNGANVESPEKNPKEPEGEATSGSNSRHPLPAPNVLAHVQGELHRQEGDEGRPQEQTRPPVDAGAGQDGGGMPAQGLRQQIQPPNFLKHQQEPPVEVSSEKTSSPSAITGGQQQLVPPQQQEAKEVPQQQPPQLQHVQFQPQAQQAAPQSQEQDTMARKPMLDQEVAGGGVGPQDLAAPQDRMFLDGIHSWHRMAGDMAVGQQIKSPEGKSRLNNNHMNNGLHPDEEANYPDDGDDDNAEEQDETLRDKNAKPFQDHDFEDNDGNDHNHAKEEGIVIAPK